jgi:hypothetical protein
MRKDHQNIDSFFSALALTKMSCPARIYPLRQPKGHRPPVPRWQLKLPESIDRVFTAYIGVQRHSTASSATVAAERAAEAIHTWLKHDGDRPISFESFSVIDGDDVTGADVWVCYWTDAGAFDRSVQRLSLSNIHSCLSSGKESVGLWGERFSTAVSHLETNYSGLDYLPGLARFPGMKTVEHDLSAYWGAARDRIPDSGHDLFERDGDASTPPVITFGIGEHLVGQNYENMVHIRSGQFWERCGVEERESYEKKLEPALKTGLAYLWQNPFETGTIGLRYLRNKGPSNEHVLKETCGAGFFRSLGDLEHWAERHPSHLAIYLGAIKHAKFFGETRKLRTWHEVSVLKHGDAHFEYVNCQPRTGAIRFVSMERSPMSDAV